MWYAGIHVKTGAFLGACGVVNTKRPPEPKVVMGVAMKLSDINIKRAKPSDSAYKIFDGGGLYLQVEPTGGKLWRYKYRFEGKERKVHFGKYPDVSLLEARRRHREAREQLAERLHLDTQWIERQLSHKTSERLGESYDRTQFLEDRRQMMQTWADYLYDLKAPKDAVPKDAAKKQTKKQK